MRDLGEYTSHEFVFETGGRRALNGCVLLVLSLNGDLVNSGMLTRVLYSNCTLWVGIVGP